MSNTTTTITARVSATIDRDLREFFKARGKGPSEGVRDIIEEFWVGIHFAHIEFKDSPTGRRAAIRRGPDVWEIISYWREYAPDMAGLEEHFGWLEAEALEEAIEYYEAFPGQVDALILENERYGQYLMRTFG